MALVTPALVALVNLAGWIPITALVAAAPLTGSVSRATHLVVLVVEVLRSNIPEALEHLAKVITAERVEQDKAAAVEVGPALLVLMDQAMQVALVVLV